MCRIAGIFDPQLPSAKILMGVDHMCMLQKHGGPDDGGTYANADGKLVLGNRRLSLIDLSHEGHMPMRYQDRYVITYNGELYNYIELRQELSQLGHQFNSKTDTEVILAAFAQWGPLAFCKLKGMFAFALYDEICRELYLVRDPAGIKPLYYSTIHSSLYFASEFRAIQAVIPDADTPSDWPVYLLAYGHLPEPVTMSKDIRPLPKGFFLKYHLEDRQSSLQLFNHFSYSNQHQQQSEVFTSIRHTMDDAVKRHLIADAPIGVFLSGGLDSGILAAVASKYHQSELKALSIYFDEEAYSEKKYQDLLIDQLQCRAHQYLLTGKAFQDALGSILNDMDLPSCDGINTWFISRQAASIGLKAVLSGLGGDELFGGYPSFYRMNKSMLLQQLPDFIKTIGKKSASKRLNRLSYLKMEGIKGQYLFLRGHFTPHEIARQLNADEKEIWNKLNEMPVIMDPVIASSSNKASWMEFNMYMQNQLLRDADVMGMKHSVEIRVPFLDHDVISLANSIDPEIKYAGELPKQILIDTFKNDIPEAIWKRPKMGFSFPFSQWLAGSEYVSQLMMNGSKSSQLNYQKFMNGKLHWSHLMSLIILKHRKAI
jgi:asparagine synthase (glutamine-hydrolysing)